MVPSNSGFDRAAEDSLFKLPLVGLCFCQILCTSIYLELESKPGQVEARSLLGTVLSNQGGWLATLSIQ